MRILAVETSGPVGSVCLCDDENVLAERSFTAQEGLRGRQQHGRELVPCVETLFRAVGWDPVRDVELVALGKGPGSFTGLRVAVAFVKTFVWAADCKVIGVPSLDVTAQNALAVRDRDSVCVVVDAKRGQVYCASYEIRGKAAERRGEIEVLTPAEALRRVTRPVLLLGNGLTSYGEEFRVEGATFGDEALWAPRASVAARLGLAAFRAGKSDAALDLTPIYIRLPEAEEKRLSKHV